MIIFTKLKYKNFLSSGNKFTTIDLNRSSSTLIVGANGSGKSTLLDAMSFALFGKPHRNINKPQLVNTINNKECIVEIEFSIGKTHFRVMRGIKPNLFEIWKNDTMLNQSSHAKEYQKILEQNIVKLNHKSFHQIVVLGSSSFIPFMQLPAQHRRDVIEDLLDINIFSKMNSIVKDRNTVLREQLKDIDYNLGFTKEKIELQRKYIREIGALNQESAKNITKKIDTYRTQIGDMQSSNFKDTTAIEGLQDGLTDNLKKMHDKKTSLSQYQHQFRTQISGIGKETKFYEDNTHCPTCDQDIAETVRNTKLTESASKAEKINDALDKADYEMLRTSSAIELLDNKAREIRERNADILANNKSVDMLQKQINESEAEMSKLSDKTSDTAKANNELSELIEKRDAYTEQRLIYNEDYSYNTVMNEMLRDTGIKTKVIKEYLPIINKLVNQYLQTLDFFVHFNLDEAFVETIRSRHRDSFSYDSFSEGEKQRIDLALLFAWRQIAKMKNSVATNLLVLDETFDSSLDHDGVENLMKILNTLDTDTNVFVISHKGEILDGRFKDKIEFSKQKNFSTAIINSVQDD
jgi:DNA repair exonuclease SbcCD ATPase subunit